MEKVKQKKRVSVPLHLIMDLHASGIETIEQMRQADFNYTADCLEGKA